MELIKRLGRRKNKTGDNYSSWGEFFCCFCNKIVEKQIGNGLRDKSCGCVHDELMSKANMGHMVTEEARQKIGLANKGKIPIEETREKISLANTGKKRTEEQRQRYSEAFKGRIITEETRQKLKESHTGKTGELASNWQNGKSFEKYGRDFNKKLKQQILERDNNTCQCSDCEYKSVGLDIHHIDYNKKNNSSENLITLCKSCHAKTNGKNNRLYWIKFYQNIIEKIYAY